MLRKDRVEGAGETFVCVKKQFNATEEYKFNADAELIWAKVTIPKKRPIYVCSFYHPPDNNHNPVLQLQLSLNKLLAKSCKL